MQDMISHGLLRWKLEMHMTSENRLYIIVEIWKR